MYQIVMLAPCQQNPPHPSTCQIAMTCGPCWPIASVFYVWTRVGRKNAWRWCVCELDRTYVSAVERARWNIALSNIERLAKALEVEPWTLLVPLQD